MDISKKRDKDPYTLNAGLAGVAELVARLRGEQGCPWDRVQTLESLKSHLVEEAYETLEAMDSADPGKHAEELGDLLLQVIFQARICEESNRFSLADVIDGLRDKLIRRHPHVFGDRPAADAAEARRRWDGAKAEEKPVHASPFEGVPRHLPALQRAQAVQARAARSGFDWEASRDVAAKVREELDELDAAIANGDAQNTREELGDLLFAMVNLSRFAHVDAEAALQAATAKFMRRFEKIERRAAHANRPLADCSLEEMDLHWQAVKRAERGGGCETGEDVSS